MKKVMTLAAVVAMAAFAAACEDNAPVENTTEEVVVENTVDDAAVDAENTTDEVILEDN